MARKKARKKATRKNTATKTKRAPATSGWIKASAIKFVTRNGRKTVLVRKSTPRRKKRK